MLFHSFFSHAIDLIDHNLHAGIFPKEISVVMDKPPVKTIPYPTPLPLRKITHLPDIIGGADVRLCRDLTSVVMLAHP